MDKDYIHDVNEKLINYFPEYASLNDSLKNRITPHDALTMTSGFEWNEQNVSIKDTANDLIRLFSVDDPVKYILSEPVIYKPGSIFYYNGGNTNLLGEIIRKTSGIRLNDFAKKDLFDPLGNELPHSLLRGSSLILFLKSILFIESGFFES